MKQLMQPQEKLAQVLIPSHAPPPETCKPRSHDRGFLNNTVTDIVLLNGKKLAYYKGDYENFRDSMTEARLAQQRAYDAQQQEIAHIMEFINKHDLRPKIVAQKDLGDD
eukprot:2867618-Amphidinium_carterae.1